MKKYHDISVPLDPKLPVWPGGPQIEIYRTSNIEKDGWTVSEMKLDLHSGTHIDAPLHIVPNGKTTVEIPLDKLIGVCEVVEFFGKSVITADDLNRLNLEKDVQKLLLKTDNSKMWDNPHHTFYEDFCALSADGAQWIVDNKIHLVGIDYLSIQRFYDSPDTHVILLENEVVILETLDLRAIKAGKYKLICMPLKVNGVEGVSARAVLETLA